jgi:large subunit ribosomal protein L25
VAENALVAELRDATGKGVALLRLLQSGGAGMNTLIELSVDGATRTVLVKELQRDPVRGRPLHTDFYLVELDQTVEVSVPLHLVGKAPGVELGGILDHPLREIELECLPRAIPESVDVDVSALEVGDSIHVRDLELPEGVSVQTDANLAVASVITPAVVEEPVAEEPEEGEEALAEGEEAEEGAEAAPEESAERTKGKGGE